MNKNKPAFACLHGKVWSSMLWTLAPKCKYIIQEDWGRIVFSITSGYMLPIAKYSDLNYGFKLPLPQERWFHRKRSRKIRVPSGWGSLPWSADKCWGLLSFWRTFQVKNINHGNLRYEGDISRKKRPLWVSRDYMQERELSFQSKLFCVYDKVELVEKSVRFRYGQLRW